MEGKGCTDAKRRECRGRNGPYLQLICDECDDQYFVADPYVIGLYQTCMLMEAGFPFDGDDFSLGYWLDLAVMKQAVERKRFRCPLG